jgi:protein-tyrosine phosphatase
MVDIHNHILPGLDDGAATWADSELLLRACIDDGTYHLALTPHIFPGVFDNTADKIRTAFNQFVNQCAAGGFELGLSWASEVRLCPEVLELLVNDQLGFLGESDGMRNLLVEMPDGQIPLGADRFFEALFARQVRPVIVHPERNKAVMEKPQRLQRFCAMGCAVQITAGSLVGGFGQRARLTAHQLLIEAQKDNWTVAIASDTHNLKSRAPQMTAARRWLTIEMGEPAAWKWLVHTPSILCGLPAASVVIAAV